MVGAPPPNPASRSAERRVVYYSFQEAASPLALDQAAVDAMPNNNRRMKRDGGDDPAVDSAIAGNNNGRKRSIAKIITSLAALDAEVHADGTADDASCRELADADSEAAVQSNRLRLLASAAAATAVVVAGDEATNNTTTSALPLCVAGQHHQRRLWGPVAASQAWLDRCNSADFSR